MSERNKASALAALSSFIRSYPTLFGMTIGLILVVGVIASVDWFPQLGKAWARHNGEVRSAFFTLALFAIMIYGFWRFHRRSAFVFWASVSGFFLAHTFGIILYSIRVHPLLLREWMAIIIVEPFLIVFALDRITKRFTPTQKQPHSGFPNADPDRARR